MPIYKGKEMIIFGYKNKFSSILRACAAIGIGLIMIAMTDATVTLVKIIAAFIFAAGVVSGAFGYAKRENGAFQLMSVNAIADMVLGVLLFAFPDKIANLIPQLIGIALVIFGAIQVVMLFGTMKLVGAGPFSFVIAFLALIGGVMLVFSPFTMGVMKVLAGVFLVIYGISELMSIFRVQKAQAEYEIKYGPQANTGSTSGQVSGSEGAYENVTFVDESGKLDTSGISDAKEVEFTEEN